MKIPLFVGVLAIATMCWVPMSAEAQMTETAHTILPPTQIPATAPTFSLEGFMLPDGCLMISDGCDPTVAAAPVFVPETDEYRPVINISFLAPSDGICDVGQIETIGGKVMIGPAMAGFVPTTQGERTFIGAVFYDAQERANGGADTSKGYRFAVVCRSGNGSMIWSQFYEAPLNTAT